MMSSPLFRHAAAAMKSAARESLQGTTLFKAFSQMQSSGGRLARNRLDSIVRQYGQKRMGDVLRELRNSDVGRTMTELERYSRGGASKQIMDEIFDALGPVGQIFKELVGTKGRGGSGGLQAELGFAAKLLESFGYRVIAPSEGAPDIGVGTRLGDFLQELQQQQVPAVKAHPEPIIQPQREIPEGTRGRPRKTADVTMHDGSTRRLPRSHPMLTGEFVMTPASWSVHSFAYDLENRLLYVRFYAKGPPKQKPSRPGSLYQYASVRPEEFLSFYQTRSRGGGEQGSSTPGTWVWSHLRVRGSHHAHQKDYRLAGIMNNYVPRKATLTPEGDAWYGERDVRSTTGKWLSNTLSAGPALTPRTSSLSPAGGRPQRPNPGTPNRGSQ